MSKEEITRNHPLNVLRMNNLDFLVYIGVPRDLNVGYLLQCP
jgi:hypothetical protein